MFVFIGLINVSNDSSLYIVKKMFQIFGKKLYFPKKFQDIIFKVIQVFLHDLK